jgi:hypothetical protein
VDLIADVMDAVVPAGHPLAALGAVAAARPDGIIGSPATGSF